MVWDVCAGAIVALCLGDVRGGGAVVWDVSWIDRRALARAFYE